MITRIFRARVPVELHEEFERDFLPRIIEAIKSYPGVVSTGIGLPTRCGPEEYAVISIWASTKFLAAFAGDSWDEPTLPAGMEKYVTECWVHHYKMYTPPSPQPPAMEPQLG